MAAIPLIKFEHLDGPVGFLRDRGLPVEPMLRQIRLPCMGFGDPDLWVTSHLLYGFLQSCADKYGVEDLGVLAAQRIAIQEHPWTSAALEGATTLGDALQNLFRLAKEESSHMQLWIQVEGSTAYLCHRGSRKFGSPGSGVVEDYMVTILIRFVREATGLDWVPSHIKIKRPQVDHLGALESYTHTRLLRDQHVTAIAIPTFLLSHSVLERPCRSETDEVVAPADVQSLEDGDFVGSLQRVLLPYLRQGPPSVIETAEILGTSVRTLQRRLGDNGLSYSEIMGRMQRDRAFELVQDLGRRLSEVAEDLGYSHPAHFTRAFRRWTGITPSEFRACQLREGPAACSVE